MAIRSSGRRIGKKRVADAITRFSGNVSAVADFLNLSRGTVYDKIKKFELEELLNESRERNLDELEEELYTQAKNGNTAALIFALKTQGRNRGYSEKAYLEVEGRMVQEKKDRNAKEDAQFLQDVLTELEALKVTKDGEEEDTGEAGAKSSEESLDTA